MFARGRSLAVGWRVVAAVAIATPFRHNPLCYTSSTGDSNEDVAPVPKQSHKMESFMVPGLSARTFASNRGMSSVASKLHCVSPMQASGKGSHTLVAEKAIISTSPSRSGANNHNANTNTPTKQDANSKDASPADVPSRGGCIFPALDILNNMVHSHAPTPPKPLQGRHVRTLNIRDNVDGMLNGIAVNRDGTWMAVTTMNDITFGDELLVVSLPRGRTVKHVGSYGKGPGQFNNPGRVCWGPDDVICVVDTNNHRMQQFTESGSHLRTIDLPCANSVCVSNSGHMMAVGTRLGLNEKYQGDVGGSVYLLDYMSGEVIHTFGKGDIPGAVNSIRFTPDDTQVILTADNSPGALVFNVTDGKFVKTMCNGVSNATDIEFAPSGEIIVVDRDRRRVCMYSSDGNEFVRSFGEGGPGNLSGHAGQLANPCSVAYANGRLYVLDAGFLWTAGAPARVQVYE